MRSWTMGYALTEREPTAAWVVMDGAGWAAWIMKSAKKLRRLRDSASGVVVFLTIHSICYFGICFVN